MYGCGCIPGVWLCPWCVGVWVCPGVYVCPWFVGVCPWCPGDVTDRSITNFELNNQVYLGGRIT